MFDSGLDGEKIRASGRELVPRSVRGVPFLVARSFKTTKVNLEFMGPTSVFPQSNNGNEGILDRVCN